jgi:hypothetical protein
MSRSRPIEHGTPISTADRSRHQSSSEAAESGSTLATGCRQLRNTPCRRRTTARNGRPIRRASGRASEWRIRTRRTSSCKERGRIHDARDRRIIRRLRMALQASAVRARFVALAGLVALAAAAAPIRAQLPVAVAKSSGQTVTPRSKGGTAIPTAPSASASATTTATPRKVVSVRSAPPTASSRDRRTRDNPPSSSLGATGESSP